MINFRHILWLAALLQASCGSDSKPDAPSTASFKPFSERIDDSNGYKTDADGNWVPQDNKRSSFERKGSSPYFNGDYKKKDFNTASYKKRSWWGNKSYDARSYQGNTDGSRFQTNARDQGARAPENASASRLQNSYKTDAYATNSARESGSSGIARKSN